MPPSVGNPTYRPLWTAFLVASLPHLPMFTPWVTFAWGSQLSSCTLLIPVACIYLLTQLAPPAPPSPSDRPWLLIGLLGAAALALIVTSDGFLSPNGTALADRQNWVAQRVLAWVLSLWAGAAYALGTPALKERLFPLGYLLASVPLFTFLEIGLEHFLQHGSTWVIGWMFTLSGLTHSQSGTIFVLPGITLEVAPECSGIQSSVVLFLVSLLAGYLFLRSYWRRALLSVLVIPLALLRNGFRVWVLAHLCVYDDVKWIHSDLHHKGGPIFFALSLIPFSLLLYWLWRQERRPQKS